MMGWLKRPLTDAHRAGLRWPRCGGSLQGDNCKVTATYIGPQPGRHSCPKKAGHSGPCKCRRCGDSYSNLEEVEE